MIGDLSHKNTKKCTWKSAVAAFSVMSSETVDNHMSCQFNLSIYRF